MKIRSGFVSNSSSSSFIVIDKRGAFQKLDIQGSWVVDGSQGETEFGWSSNTYFDIYSKINFAYMQALYIENDDWIEMLEDVIKENSEVTDIDWVLNTDNVGVFAYIDHQSASYEGENIEMFDSKEDLTWFIFGPNSEIVTGNDN